MRWPARSVVPAVLVSGLLFVGGQTPVLPPVAVPSPVEWRPFGRTVFPDSVPNAIADSTASLDPFYGQLAALRIIRAQEATDSAIIVPILHIGDSHIQAGFLTGVVMREFHRDFGNAGRGLVTPLRLAKTNEPGDYAIRSEQPWESTRLTRSVRPLPVGLGGMAIGTQQADFSLALSTLAKDSAENYAFDRLRVLKHPAAPVLQAADVPIDTTEQAYGQVITLGQTVSELILSGRSEGRDSSIYYGFSLENGRSGVLYHAAGINGAQFAHWPRVQGLGEQAAALRPALIILSMGTNEALAGAGFSPERLEGQIDTLVCRLRQTNPQAVFLLTTPPDSYRRRRVRGRTTYTPNPQVEHVAAVIRNYAYRNGLACWDLHTISGGAGSCEMWQREGLFGRDRLHFTAEGYTVQGHYLYHALIQGFNDYVRDRYGEPAPATEL